MNKDKILRCKEIAEEFLGTWKDKYDYSEAMVDASDSYEDLKHAYGYIIELCNELLELKKDEK